ncbi:MAG: hypothetical protein GWN71_24565, partial [Gammaproteobacteria bacterium]|nr:hypothetical protein [Gemmatimonadota bacterium]NIU76618.1 hypothetical protein [Gammaproteobacteria bacterium]NIX22396.1 hypothetical protein [Actinomycetota bacterium]
LDALPLEDGSEYVWQVEALDILGRPITAGGRSSEIWVFHYGEEEEEEPPPVAGVLPDTIPLIAGVARLRGLTDAEVRETETGYRIDGTVTLEIYG